MVSGAFTVRKTAPPVSVTYRHGMFSIVSAFLHKRWMHCSKCAKWRLEGHYEVRIATRPVTIHQKGICLSCLKSEVAEQIAELVAKPQVCKGCGKPITDEAYLEEEIVYYGLNDQGTLVYEPFCRVCIPVEK